MLMSSMALNWRSLLISLRFLTIIPVPSAWIKEEHNSSVQTGALIYYPLIGAIIGALLVMVDSLFSPFSSLLSSAFLLTAWVLITGALHLDGLADSADAWLGGHGDKEKTLRILKDTHSGVAAMVAIVLVLLLKLTCINELGHDRFMALLFAPILARAAVVGLLMSTDYVREKGIASAMLTAYPKKRIWAVLFIVSVILVAVMPWNGVYIMISIIIAVLVFRYMIKRRIGGTTGDTAGALVELIELLVLFDFILIEQML